MPDPNPVRPRVKDAKAYERALRPWFDAMFARDPLPAGNGPRGRRCVPTTRRILADMRDQPFNGIPAAKVTEAVNRIEQYHKARMIAAFRAALGVDIRLLLIDPQVAGVMAQRIAENIALISTIPERAHESLRRAMMEAFEEAPFDQERLTALLRDEYRKSGYVLRRIVRDQTNKTIGELSQVRQQQAGIEQYRWLTAADERVRPTHVANSGRLFAWQQAPVATGHPGHDIQCRCVAQAMVTRANRDRLTQIGAAVSIA